MHGFSLIQPILFINFNYYKFLLLKYAIIYTMLNMNYATDWTWFVLGVLLIGFELFLPTFITFCLGVSAILVGILTIVFPELSLDHALILWALLSIFTTFMWFKVLKPSRAKRTISTADIESVKGQEGIVIVSNERRADGIIRFTVPVLEHSEWPFICDKELKEGDKASIVSFENTTIVVEKL